MIPIDIHGSSTAGSPQVGEEEVISSGNRGRPIGVQIHPNRMLAKMVCIGLKRAYTSEKRSGPKRKRIA
jgi:hypothetical protein